MREQRQYDPAIRISSRLRKEKMKKELERDSLDDDNDNIDEELDNDNFVEDDVVDSYKKTKNKKALSAKKKKLSRKVRTKIRKERFDGLVFYSAIILAMINDLSDIVSLGFFSAFSAIAVAPLLSVLLWIGGSSKAETKLKRLVVVNIVELLPFASIFPTWTIMVIKMKLEQDNKVRKLERVLRRIEK